MHLTDVVKEAGLGIDRGIRKTNSVSLDEEKELGDQVIKQLVDDLGGRLDQTSATARYIAKVGNSMVPQVERKGVDYTYYLHEGTSTENAFALPGGHIVITRPFYDKWLKSEAELATVLAHEIAHVDEKHPLGVVVYARTLGLDDEDEVTKMLVLLARTPYTSALEEEADRLGAAFLHNVGYSIFRAVGLWERQSESDGSDPSGSSSGTGNPLEDLLDIAVTELENLTVSHPNAARRACLLKQVAREQFEELPHKEVYVGKANLRRQTPMSENLY